MIKVFQGVLNEKPVILNFPSDENTTIVLKGNLADTIMHLIESMLAMEDSVKFQNIDKDYGYIYEKFDITRKLVTDIQTYYSDTTTKVYVKDINIKSNIHIVRYLRGTTIRSILVNGTKDIDTRNDINLSTPSNMTQLDKSQWLEIVEKVNNIVGEPIIEYNDETKQIEFSFNDLLEMSIENQKLIYLLISECYLTPPHYKRILFIPNIEGMTPDAQVKLLEAIETIPRHSLTLSSSNINIRSVESDTLTILNTNK